MNREFMLRFALAVRRKHVNHASKRVVGRMLRIVFARVVFGYGKCKGYGDFGTL